MDKMKAIVLDSIRSFSFEERDIPKPAEDEALVAVKAVGICGSDIHYFENGRIGRYIVEKPIILGHESSGEVIAVGAGVKNIKPGDRVAIEPSITCTKCEYCKSGRYNLCPDVKFFATPPVDGALCQYVALKEDYLFKIPDNMSFEVATLAEPLSVGVHASIRSNVKVGDKVLILGLGPVGLLSILAVKSFGASQIIAVDIEPFRIEMAKTLGATYAFDGKDPDLKEKILAITDSCGPDVTFETAGSKITNRLATEITKRGGRIVMIGLLPDDEVPININSIIDNEYTIYGIFRYANTYKKAINILSHNMELAEKLITHRFKFDDAYQAFEFARQNKDKSIKVVILV